MTHFIRIVLTIAFLIGFISCSPSEPPTGPPAEQPAVEAEETAAPAPRASAGPLKIGKDTVIINAKTSSIRSAYFGDLHVHTTYSFDAFAFGTLATPYDAYRYAKGETIKHPAGFDVKLRKPLDFYAVTDHAMFLGMVPEASNPATELAKLDIYRPLHNLNAPENLNTAGIARRVAAFSTFIPKTLQGLADGSVNLGLADRIVRTAWKDIIAAAEKHNNPGKFTTFIGYEYTTSSDDQGNLHRNVIFKGGDRVPAIPFSRFHSQDPEGLWRWMDELRLQGIESLAIPHNSNGSNGQMFKLVDFAGNSLDDDYADQRMRNEPLVEVTQIKGTSDTHPLLSPTDEWADFEIMPYRIATRLQSKPQGSYAREALRTGLSLEEEGIGNPYKFGFVGSSDTHTGAISDDESNWYAKIGILDSTPQLRGSVPIAPEQAKAIRDATEDPTNLVTRDGRDYYTGAVETWSASGLAAVWAEENTREAIYNAFRRKETFATTGPRIRVRFFAGYDFTPDMLDSKDLVERAYTTGVTMGGDLLAQKGGTPKFLVWAARDADSAPLQRIQIVKGYMADGKSHESVYDIACSDRLLVDPTTHRCPDNGAKVDISDCSISTGVGDGELKAVWADPDFNSDQRAFYYVRVLENPTCRWSTWDAIRAGVPPRPDLKKTIQERAFTSPIWYSPGM